MTHCIFIKKISNKCNLASAVLCVLLFTWSTVTFAQQGETGWDQSLTVPIRTIRLDSLSNLLARKTGFVLSFNADKVNPGTKINFPGSEVRLDALLSYLHKHYRLANKMIGNHIILYYKTSSGKKVQITEKNHIPSLSRKRPDIADKQKLVEAPLKEEIEPPHTTFLPNIENETSLTQQFLSLQIEIGKVLTRQNNILQINSVRPALYSEKKPTHLSDKPKNVEKQGAGFSRGNDRFSASAGITTSEVLYLNPQIKIGLPRLFALASWETNFKTSGFFYGAGTSIKLSDNWDFLLSASRGTLSKDFRWPNPASDTLGRIKARLTRINMMVEKHLSDRWVLQFGPVLNFMKSKYSLMDSSLANSFPLSDVSKDVNILSPPYTLSNRFEEKTASDKKIWVGLRIGIFYTLVP